MGLPEICGIEITLVLAALFVARIILDWIREERKAIAADENDKWMNALTELFRKHREETSRAMEQRDKTYLDELRSRDAEYMRKFEEMQKRIQNLSEQKGFMQ